MNISISALLSFSGAPYISLPALSPALSPTQFASEDTNKESANGAIIITQRDAMIGVSVVLAVILIIQGIVFTMMSRSERFRKRCNCCREWYEKCKEWIDRIKRLRTLCRRYAYCKKCWVVYLKSEKAKHDQTCPLAAKAAAAAAAAGTGLEMVVKTV
jgi:hypothetical protein